VIDLVAINDGVTFLNALLSIHILVMTLIIVAVMRDCIDVGRPVLRTVIGLFAALGVWSILSRYFIAMDGESTELTVMFVASCLRIGLAIVLTAWAWNELERRSEKGRDR
jgi:hypothetical protein